MRAADRRRRVQTAILTGSIGALVVSGLVFEVPTPTSDLEGLLPTADGRLLAVSISAAEMRARFWGTLGRVIATLSDEQRHELQMIDRSGRIVGQQIDAYPRLQRLERGAFVFEPRPVDVLRLVSEVQRQYQRVADARRVLVDTLVQPGLPAELTLASDEALLFGLPSNLWLNALEASPAGSCVTVRVDCSDGLTLHTGRGAYGAKSIAESLGGSIAWTTDDAEGTTATVTLPTAGARASVERGSPPPPVGRRLTIHPICRRPRRHPRGPLPALAVPLLAPLVLVLLACSGSPTSSAEVDAGPLDVAEVDPYPFDCGASGAYGEGGLVGVVPRPWRFDLPSLLPVEGGTVSFEGAVDDDPAPAQVLADAGIDVVTSGAAVRVRWLGTGEGGGWTAGCPYGLDDEPEGYALDLALEGAEPVARVAAAAAAGRTHAMATLAQLLVAGAAAGTLPRGVIVDRPAQAVRGVLEGFYGPPWSPADRLATLAWMASVKLNLYVYAPKGDPLVNEQWRTPFPADYLAQVAELTAAAHRRHVRVAWSLRFGLPVRFSVAADRDAALAKLDQLVAAGVDQVVLAFDDTAKGLLPADVGVYATFVDGQIDFLTAVGQAFRAAHPGVPLALTPVEYFTHHPDATTDLVKLAAALPAEWSIAWTGTEIGSSTIDAADAREAAVILGRPPTLGDNYPVSDDAFVSGVLHLGPLVGRSADLGGEVAALIWNAMPLAWSSRVALGTAADYAWNPKDYEPGRSLRRVATPLAGEHGGEGLVTLALANRSAMLEGSSDPDLQAELQAYWSAREAGAAVEEAGAALQARFGAWVAQQEILGAAPLAAGLRAELEPWSDALATYGFLGYAALDLLARAADGSPAAAADVAALAAGAEAAAAAVPRPTGRLMDDFLAEVLAALR